MKKKFILTWGRGSVEGIKIMYNTMKIKAERIDDIDPTVILPDPIKKRVRYIRAIHTSDTKRNYDYGSYVDFIEAEEVKRFNIRKILSKAKD